VELSTSQIDSIVSPEGGYALVGLGGTGEINLVGDDLLLRSNAKAYEGDSVGRLKIDSPSVIKALNGESGFMSSKDDRGIDVYSAYAPVEIFDKKWALIAKINSEELISQVQEIITILFIFNLLIVVTLLLIYTYILYGTLLTPLQLKYSELQHLTNVRNSNLSLSESISDEYKKSLDLVAAVSKLNTRGIITHVNYNFCELAGYSEDELIGKSHLILRNHDASRELDEHISNVVHSKRIWNGEIKYVAKNKQESTIDLAIVPILASNGNIKEFMAIAYKL
jgi:PAS domain S-box-containing protein